MHALLGASGIFAQPRHGPVKLSPCPTRPSNSARRPLGASLSRHGSCPPRRRCTCPP
ncbi:hypothetical protein DENSPDRAFT_846174 [Dentipellis sp. KUC8613]|nr:hypothetical protein DENSPDRAFT_846174 [Dentipellis sp. KUC8613]